jgi:hypothetical protein
MIAAVKACARQPKLIGLPAPILPRMVGCQPTYLMGTPAQIDRTPGSNFAQNGKMSTKLLDGHASPPEQ